MKAGKSTRSAWQTGGSPGVAVCAGVWAAMMLCPGLVAWGQAGVQVQGPVVSSPGVNGQSGQGNVIGQSGIGQGGIGQGQLTIGQPGMGQTGVGQYGTVQNPNGLPMQQPNGLAQLGYAGQGLAGTRRVPAKPSEFQLMVQVTTGQMLPVFGAELFQQAPSTFAPVNQAPVPPDYAIGPGDEINLQIWGQNALTGSYPVDRNGQVQLPSVGTVRVQGLTAAQLQPFLKSQYDLLYKDVHLSATLGQLRSIQVFVVGYAVQPGSYTIGSLSTLVDALFACGGPLPNGSLRDIQVKRGAETLVHFDLYDFLLHGDKSKSIPLQAGDTIFIPPVGAQVAVMGSVNAPAIYELRGETTAREALQLAGGETNVASGTQVRLERIFEHRVRSVEDVDLAASTPVTVQNGDILSVWSVVDRFRNAVTLAGNVANPARYPWHAGMRVSELIPNKESLITRQYFERLNRMGQAQTGLRSSLEPTQALAPGELGVEVLPTRRLRGEQQLGQNGVGVGAQGTEAQGVGFQGTGALGAGAQGAGARDVGAQGAGGQSQGETSSSVASSLTDTTSGFEPVNRVMRSAPDIDWSYAVIERQDKETLQTSLIPFNLGKLVLDGDQSQNMELQPGDVVRIFSKADIPVPVAQRTRFVQLAGEFASPGWYSVLPGETLRHLITRAGGLTGDAYLYGSEFSRESTRRLQQQRLQQIADDLESEISATLARSSSGVLGAAQAAVMQSAQDARATVARLRRTVPNGRISLDLKPDSRGLESIPDMALEDGDRFVVPHTPDNVSVAGQVYNASAFVFRAGRRVKDYLKQAGGPNREADKSRLFVLRADGSVVSNQYTNVEKAAIYPGDTVVVPPLVDRRSFFRNLVDVSSVLTGLGVPLATIYLLARQ